MSCGPLFLTLPTDFVENDGHSVMNLRHALLVPKWNFDAGFGLADWPKWLGEEPATPDELYAPLKPAPDEILKAWPVDNGMLRRRQRRGTMVSTGSRQYVSSKNVRV